MRADVHQGRPAAFLLCRLARRRLVAPFTPVATGVDDTACPDIVAVYNDLLNVLPALDTTDRALSLALYRELARGAPAAPASLAARLGIPVADVVARLHGWPGVYYDGEGRVVGYWGLALARTQHRLSVDGRELYTWCAWDPLFLPALLGARAEVASVCRGSGEPARLTVDPGAVVSADPAGLLVSFLLPDPHAVRADLITSFWH